MGKRRGKWILGALLFILLSVTAFASEEVPAGYTPVYTPEDLDRIRQNLSGNYMLMNDLDMSDWGDWNPIGESLTDNFNGRFDGNGHRISNLKIRIGTDEMSGAMFRSVGETGVVQGLRLEESSVELESGPRTLVTCAGSIAVQNFGKIIECSSSAKVSIVNLDNASFVGGLVYQNTGEISRCSFRGHVFSEGKEADAGGLAHSNYGIIQDCYNSGSVHARAVEREGKKYSNTGGLVAENGEEGRMICAYNRGTVEGPHMGGICGTASDYSGINHCFYTIETNEECDPSADEACLGEEMGTEAAYKGFDFVRVWVMEDTPVLRWEQEAAVGEAPEAEGPETGTRETEPAEEEEQTEAALEPTEEEEQIEEVLEPVYTDPCPEGTVTFHYAGINGGRREYFFYFNNFMFYTFETTFKYEIMLARASLCLEMASFTDNQNLCWNDTLEPGDNRRASNIIELYEKLGFIRAKYVNYDKPLTDTSDKVAFSMAVKYMDDDEGGTDTLVAVVIRGGGYGGEWASNFNLSESGENKNHLGFQRAADGVRQELDAYIHELKEKEQIEGTLKLWITGYSRAAAVANLLTHDINTLGIDNEILDKKDVYAYTFATPAGAASKSVRESYDPNIFNIISPVDLVPRVAPRAWGYRRYGNTLTLPFDNPDRLAVTYLDLTGEDDIIPVKVAVMPVAKGLLDKVCEALFTLIPDKNAFREWGLQRAIQKIISEKEGFGKEPTGKKENDEISQMLDELTDQMARVNHPLAKPILDIIKNELTNVTARSHHAEYYLARLMVYHLETPDDYEDVERSVDPDIRADDFRLQDEAIEWLNLASPNGA